MYFSIKDFIKKNGYSPTYRELAKINGNSVATVHYHLHKLKEKNIIDFVENKNRTITILK
jgi:SOS-response transcriptional repressor LexA